MVAWSRSVSRFFLLFGVVNLILYLGQHLLGLGSGLRFWAGLLILMVGAVSLWGQGLRSDVVSRGYFGRLNDAAIERFKKDRYNQESFGWLLSLLGLATMAFALLFS